MVSWRRHIYKMDYERCCSACDQARVTVAVEVPRMEATVLA